MDDYASVEDIAKRLEKEFDELKSNKIGFIKDAKNNLAKIWPVAEKSIYISKYRSYRDTEWLVNGKEEAIILANIDRSNQPEDDGRSGVIFRRDIVFIKDRFFKVDFRIDWDKRYDGSNKETFTTHELTDERLLKFLSDDSLFKAFANTVSKINKIYSKK